MAGSAVACQGDSGTEAVERNCCNTASGFVNGIALPSYELRARQLAVLRARQDPAIY